jgi:peptidyl-dipeptidase Dcp
MTKFAPIAPNPLLAPWIGPFEAPPFAAIRPEHFRPAFDAAMEQKRAEIAAIAEQSETPDFANTIDALERSGKALDRVGSVFYNLAGADSSDALEAIERDMAPLLSRLSSEVYLNAGLFGRIAALYAQREALDLSAEQGRVLERYHLAFTRHGAALGAPDKATLAANSERLATLGAQFGQNVLADEKSWILVLGAPDDLAGLSGELIAAAAEVAEARGYPGKHAVTLSRSSLEPFLQYATRRDLREKVWRAFVARGANGGETDNRAIASKTVALRAEQAKLLGYETYAQYRLADTMAKTPDAALGLLRSVWGPARGQAEREAEALRAMIAADGDNFALEAWDWRFYAERRRKALFDIDEAEIKPYLELGQMIDAAFDVAHRLFGLTFDERRDIALYHPDARCWTVSDARGEPIALFIGDYFARPSKHSGAWMSSFRDQQKLDGPVLPIIVNVLNFAKAGAGEPSLLSSDDARTLFHEFGHALHGMMSDVAYPLLSGTNVSRDFVEFPSHLYEHWLERPEILRRFARHHVTGAPMPEDLLQRLIKARRFNQGFATVEFVASALVDFALHLEAAPGELDVAAYEKRKLDEIGMPAEIAMRHRIPHFQHIFSGEGYSAGYYSYLWSEVLDSDGFEAFEESGDVFDPTLARRLKEFVYAAGNSREPEAAYTAFRGRAPRPEALLRKRGLAADEGS